MTLLVLSLCLAEPTASEDFTRERTSVAEVASSFAALKTAVATDLAQRRDPKIAARLLRQMRLVDQAARNADPSDARTGRLMAAVDSYNLATLKTLLTNVGWFDIPDYGEQADADAWLLVQHADGDTGFQKDVLARLETRVPQKRTGRDHFAYLWDRVAVHEGRPQRYGTQGKCVSNGRWEPDPLEDPSHVDERRAWANLYPGFQKLADYQAVMSQTFCTITVRSETRSAPRSR